MTPDSCWWTGPGLSWLAVRGSVVDNPIGYINDSSNSLSSVREVYRTDVNPVSSLCLINVLIKYTNRIMPSCKSGLGDPFIFPWRNIWHSNWQWFAYWHGIVESLKGQLENLKLNMTLPQLVMTDRKDRSRMTMRPRVLFRSDSVTKCSISVYLSRVSVLKVTYLWCKQDNLTFYSSCNVLSSFPPKRVLPQ